MRAEDAGGTDRTPARRAFTVRRSPYAEAVLADRPASYWRLGEATGSEVAEDDTGAQGARVGQRYYTPAFGLPGALAGDPSTAARLHEYANLPAGDAYGFEGRAAFTAEAWVKPDVQDNRRRRVLSKEAGLSGWYLALGASSSAAGRLFLTRRHEGHGGNVEGTSSLPTTRWSHVAATYDGAIMRLYLNGALEGSAPSTIAMADNGASLTLGENPTGYDSFKGLLDEVAVYPHALAAERLAEHFRVGWGDDLAAPETTIGAGPAGVTPVTSASFSFSASEAGARFECRLDAAGWTPCASPLLLSGLGDGEHAFEVRATEGRDQTDETPARRTWTVDLPPETRILPGASRAVAPTSSVSVSSSQPGSSFACRLDLGLWAPCGSPVRLRDLAEGAHALEVRATDSGGTTDATPARATLTVAASPYARAVLADGPLSYWRLGEGSGVYEQDETGGHDGEYGRSGWYTDWPGLRVPGAAGDRFEHRRAVRRPQAGRGRRRP